ncbi:MAG: sulfite exporter TauE/SafE family protein [Pseudomonadota bacterium]
MTMATLNLIPVFLTGLVGGLHCIGMCGGIVSAFSVASGRPPFPVAVVAAANDAALPASRHEAPLSAYMTRALAYNGGRIGSYMLAGAVAGGIGGGILALTHLSSLQLVFYWMANLVLVVLGLYMLDLPGARRSLAWLESLGQIVWRRVSPLTRRLLPLDSHPKSFAMGALWGWLPCGMVYSSLLTAMLAGSAQSGALVMLAFGAGTLPTLMLIGLMGAQLRRHLQRPLLRTLAGALILGFGILGLIRAAYGAQASWLDHFCISPSTAVAGTNGMLQ